MPTMKISHRLIGGFAVMILLLVVAVVVSLREVGAIRTKADLIVELRTPTSQASAAMTSNIYASLSALRGWMLIGKPAFKAERAAVWTSIAKTVADMDRLSANWTNPKNIAVWAKFKTTLHEFSVAQDKVEAIANTTDEQPATKMLIAEAAPRAAVMLKMIAKIIDLELAGRRATGDRVQFLGMMPAFAERSGSAWRISALIF